MSQVLQLTFKNGLNHTLTISIDSPKANLTEAEVNAAMQTVIDQGVFVKEGYVFNSKKSAQIVERNVTPFELSV